MAIILTPPKVSCTAVDIGQAPVITITNATFYGAQADLDWTLTYEFGSHSGTIATHTKATRFTDFVWPTTFYNEIPNATLGKGVLLLDYYEDGVHKGTTDYTFTVYVNASTSAPTIALPSIWDINSATTALTGSSTKFIRYMSTADVKVSAEAKNGASIVNVTVTNGGRGFNVGDPAGVVNGVINGIESPTFTVQAKDSRGFITTITYEIPKADFIEYVKLTCNAGNEMPDTDGTMRLTCSGNWWYGVFGSSNSNAVTLKYRYKEQGGDFGAWATMNSSASSNGTYDAYIELTGLNYRTTYIFECQAQDKLMTASSGEKVEQATPVFHWSADDFVFEVPVTFKQGAIGVDSLPEGATATAGSWTPTLSTAAAVSSYNTRSGWYVRIGNVVTVGFNISASCNSGYNGTAIAITGLPFTPITNAFGGGVMFGAYVGAGFCFEAWAANTSGQIGPRLQPCNPTAAGNLQISSTAYYPSGGGSLTLGGTITYITN
jgi:hypothetical protein